MCLLTALGCLSDAVHLQAMVVHPTCPAEQGHQSESFAEIEKPHELEGRFVN